MLASRSRNVTGHALPNVQLDIDRDANAKRSAFNPAFQLGPF
jgi:hypothetical protein